MDMRTVDTRAVRVFCACFLGAFIGALVSLELKQSFPYFWWMGTLIGGLVGYLSYEFKEVCRTVPMAWKSAIGWRPNWLAVRARITYLFGLFTAFSSVFCFITLLSMFVLLASKHKFFEEGVSLTTIIINNIVGILFLSAICTFLFGIIGLLIMRKDFKDNEKVEKIFADWGAVIILGNPVALSIMIILGIVIFAVAVIFIIGYLLIRFITEGIPFIIDEAPDATRMSGCFIKEVFILIHSDLRLLVGVDAAIGATAGYFCSSVLFGAFFGGIFGVLNFIVISQWWLGLCKVKAEN